MGVKGKRLKRPGRWGPGSFAGGQVGVICQPKEGVSVC